MKHYIVLLAILVGALLLGAASVTHPQFIPEANFGGGLDASDGHGAAIDKDGNIESTDGIKARGTGSDPPIVAGDGTSSKDQYVQVDAATAFASGFAILKNGTPVAYFRVPASSTTAHLVVGAGDYGFPTSGIIPVANLGTGTPTSLKYLDGTGAWSTPTPGSVAFSTITGQPTDNTNLSSALSAKADLNAAVAFSSVTTNYLYSTTAGSASRKFYNQAASGAPFDDWDFTSSGLTSAKIRFFRLTPSPSGVCQIAIHSPNTLTENIIFDAKTGNGQFLGVLKLGTAGLTVSDATTGKILAATALTGATPIANGGTGATTASGARIALDAQQYNALLADIAALASLANGDTVEYSSGHFVKTSPGTNGYFKKSQGPGQPTVWAAVSGGGDMLSTNNLSDVADAPTAIENLSSLLADIAGLTLAEGDVLYYDSTGHIINLPHGVAGYALLTGGAGAPPAWGQVQAHSALLDDIAGGTYDEGDIPRSDGANLVPFNINEALAAVSLQALAENHIFVGNASNEAVDSASLPNAAIQNGGVSLAKLADLTNGYVIGRHTASPGVPEAISLADLKSDLSLNNVENTALSTWAGSSNLTTFGTSANDFNIASGKVYKINSSQIGFDALVDFTAGTPASGHLMLRNTGNTAYADVAMSGKGTMAADGTLSLTAASDTVSGISELATAAETTTGTDAARAVTPDGLAGSDFGKRVMSVKITDDATAPATGDGKIIFCVFSEMTGYNLVSARAYVTTVSSSGLPSIMIRNVTDSHDMLSTAITIDANETTSYTAAAPSVVNATYDDVATGDLIAIDVDGVGTGTKGLGVILTFVLP
jgi:hypothetical protein